MIGSTALNFKLVYTEYHEIGRRAAVVGKVLFVQCLHETISDKKGLEVVGMPSCVQKLFCRH
jgi:hypothetical protein